MNLQTHKLNLIAALLDVNDEKLLARVESILKSETRQKEIVPMTMEEYNAEIDRALEDYHAGRFISQAEMEKKISGWK